MWSAAFKIAQVGTSYMIIIMYRLLALYVLLVLYLPKVLGLFEVLYLLDVLCLLKVFYFKVPISLTVSYRISSLTAKNCCFLPLCVKNADLYQLSLIFTVFQISLFQQVFNFGIMKNVLLLLFHK